MSAERKPELAKIGMIGLAVMGENLALNIARNGFPIAVYNRDSAKVDKFLHRAEGKQVIGSYSIEDFVKSLETPRKIILLVKAGAPVDQTVEKLLPFLEKDDIILEIGDRKIRSTEDVLDAAFFTTAEDELPIKVSRGGKEIVVNTIPTDHPNSTHAPPPTMPRLQAIPTGSPAPLIDR